jgi:hypothetical protein
MDIPRKELELGIKDETGEHGMSKKQAAKTAIDHLKKNKNYYSKLKSIGLEEMENVEEDFDTSINVEGGSIDINDDAVLDAVNRKLAGLTTKSCITPYIKLQKIRELLAYYNIFLPQTVFLEGDDGNEVFEISQFGEKIGMDNQGVVKKKNSDGLYLYFEWVTNDSGMIDVFAEVVDKEDLEELLSDFKDEYDDGDDDEDSDGAETSFDTYKASNMNEETVNEDDMDLFDDDDKPKKKEKKAKAFVHKTSGKEIKSVGKAPSKDWKKLDEEKKKHTRVVTASKKAEKGTKWKVQARNPDSEGSEVELRQGKRVKMKGYFDRNANDFTMDPTKKNKIDWKSNKTQSFNSGKDILKTVKESIINELSKGTLGSYVTKASHDVATKSAAVGRYAERGRNKRANNDVMGARKDDETSDKMFKKSWKRRQGIAKATDKLTREETINEVSAELADRATDAADKKAKKWAGRWMMHNRDKKLQRQAGKIEDKAIKQSNKFSKYADKKRTERLDELSAGKAEKAYQSAKNKLLDNDIMVSMTKGATRKKWLKKSDKRRDQAVKFANYSDKKKWASKKIDEENKKLYGWLNPKGSFIRNRGYNIHGDTYTKFTGVRKPDYWDKIADATSKGWQRLDLYKNDDKTVDGVIQGDRKKWTPRHGKSLARIKKAIGADGYKNFIQKVPHINEANEPFEGPYVQKGKEKSNPDRRASTIARKALKKVKKKMNKGETEKQWRKRMQDRYETLQYKGD